MGRRTWDSLPIQPLPDRLNIVISTKERFDTFSYDWDNQRYVFGCLQNAVDTFAEDEYDTMYIIGGASIYKEALDLDIVDELDITWVKGDYHCDTFFPDINWEQWIEGHGKKITKDATVVRYKRKQ